MLRILQICNKAPFPPNDGSSIAIYNMARGIMSNGAELHLLTINTKKHFKPDENVPADLKSHAHYRSVYRDTDTSAFGAMANIFSTDSYFVSRFYFSEFENAIVEKLKNEKFDIVQLDGLFVGNYIPAIRKHSAAKIVLRAHNIEHLIWERHIANEKSFLKKKYLQLQNSRLKKFEERILNEVDAIVTITDADKKLLGSFIRAKKIYTCITGVDTAEYAVREPVKEIGKSIFSFASMDWMPNQEAVDWFLENCWKKVRAEVPDCKLIIAGRNMPERFRSLKETGIEVIENVNSSKEFYQTHQVMLVPLLSGSGLRIKIIEGMAYGKAIVSTSVGAEGIEIENGKNILIADQPDDFSNAVITLLKDEEKRRRLGAEARKMAEAKFDNKAVVSGLIKFYESLNG